MTDETGEWARRLRENREEKDRFFREHRQSPIPTDERDAFDGLAYFDPDPAYRVEAAVEVYEDPDPVELEVRNGPPTRYQRVVTFTFELEGGGGGGGGGGGEAAAEHCELHGYRGEGDESGVFVPFRDKTTGQETYAGGRYMELDVEGDLADLPTVTLDFNLAYTPFCAFNDAFACPLPPEENWLEATVAAGERAP